MTVRRFHYARLMRQYRKLAKDLTRWSKQATPNHSFRKKFRRFLALHRRLAQVIPAHRLRPIIASVGLVVGSWSMGQAQSFNPSVQSPFGVADEFFFAQPGLADIDNDGDLDLFFGGYYGSNFYGNVTFMENIGTAQNPEFGAGISAPFGIDLEYSGNPEFADFDNDGDLDLLVGTYFGFAPVTYYENVGTATAPEFANPQANPFGITVSYTFISNIDAADLDNDGDIDVVVNSYLGDFIYFENTGTPEAPAFTNAGDLDLSLGFAYLRSTEFVDLDSDGDLDLLQHDYSFYYYGSGVIYTENIGDPETPTFDTPQTSPFGIFGLYVYSGNYSSITAGDLDSDGDIDVWVGTDFDGLLYFENTSAVNAAPLSENTFIEVEENDSYLFAAEDFPIIDPEGDELVEVQITALPSVGILSFKGLSVTLNQIIPVANLGGIAYTPLPDEFGTNYDSFQFKVSDGFNFSNDSYTMTVNVLEGQNATPSSEDITIQVQESSTYAFTNGDFPFSDPDGDAFEALRISTLPGAGGLTLAGVPVISGQEIPAAQIEDLLFTPVAGETGQPYTSFTFQVGDGENFSAVANTVTINVGDNVSTQEILEVANWSLSPNPAQDHLQLEGQLLEDVDRLNLSLFNSQGQEMLQLRVTLGSEGRFNEQVELRNLTPGIYWLQLATSEKYMTKKVILQ